MSNSQATQRHDQSQDVILDVSGTADGAFVVNARQCIVSWNAAAEAILGYRAQEVLGLPCGSVLCMCDEQGNCGSHTCRAISNAMHGSLTPYIKFAVKTKSGARRWLSMSTLNGHSAAGEVQIVHIFHDITEHYVAASTTASADAHLATPVVPDTAQTPSVSKKSLERLTRRERQVLQLLATGMTTSDMATALSISPITARNHVTKVIEKLEVKTRLQAVVVASRAGLI